VEAELGVGSLQGSGAEHGGRRHGPARATAAFGRQPRRAPFCRGRLVDGQQGEGWRGEGRAGLAAMAGERAVRRDGAELTQAGSAPGREGGWLRAAMGGRERTTAARSARGKLRRAAGA